MRTVHTDLKPYICHLCDKSFGDSGNLKRHIRTKHLKLRIQCPDCNRSCFDKGDLSRHRKEKHSESPLICKFCGIDFHSTSGLTFHVNSKHKEIPTEYPCEICGTRGFLTPTERSTHKLHIHGLSSGSLSTYPCKVCFEKFPTKESRKAHSKAKVPLKS